MKINLTIMIKFEMTLSTDILRTKYKWLKRNFKKGEKVYLLIGNNPGCISDKGIACLSSKSTEFFELPTTKLAIKHNNKEFGIFMTEKGMGYQLLYCKELPIDYMELLTKTQSNVHLLDRNKQKPEYKVENKILKVLIKESNVSIIEGQLEDIEPLF
jgi:hypothetical protein